MCYFTGFPGPHCVICVVGRPERFSGVRRMVPGHNHWSVACPATLHFFLSFGVYVVHALRGACVRCARGGLTTAHEDSHTRKIEHTHKT